jgi:hypothetical protein
LLIVVMSDKNVFMIELIIKMNEDWWIVASQESLVKCSKLSNKWRSILEDNNLLFLCVLRGNVFSNYKCH